MPGGQDRGSSIRPPAVAGMFYPADPAQCRRLARRLVEGDGGGAAAETAVSPTASSGEATRWLGGIVPHAGWIASGAVAGQSLRALAASTREAPPQLVVVFGAVHTPIDMPLAALDSHARWAVPGGDSTVRQELGAKLTESSDLFAVDDRFHDREHAVEVELPLIQVAWPDVEVLPVEVPLVDDAPEIGRRTARQVAAAGLSALFLASSDLTHYGPSYRFAPAGIGPQGLAWAKDNDRRVLGLVTALAFDRVVPEVRQRANACGGGAIAAMLSACRELGATRATVLRHTNSFETLAGVAPQRPVDAVGYAAVVVG